MFLPITIDDETEQILERYKEIRKKLLNDCISAILVLGQNRSPIKRQELNKLVFTSHNHRLNNSILLQANEKLNETFGLRLFEVEDKKNLLLVNSSTCFSSYLDFTESMRDEFTILYFILIEIFTSTDESLEESSIESTLEPLGYPKETLKSHIDSLVKKLYLTATKLTYQQDIKSYSWGPRSLAEIDLDGFFDSFLNLVESSSSKEWPELEERIRKLREKVNA